MSTFDKTIIELLPFIHSFTFVQHVKLLSAKFVDLHTQYNKQYDIFSPFISVQASDMVII